jgi:Rubrerythrin
MHEVTQMYPAYIAVAQLQGEKEAENAMKYAVAAEKVHAELYTKAKEYVDQGKDLDAKVVKLCPVCGYITITGEEDKCPLCGASIDRFIEY